MIMQEKKSGTSDVEHKAGIQYHVTFAVITVSDTRTKKDDLSGTEIISAAEKVGNSIVEYAIVKDNIISIQDEVRKMLDNKLIDVIVLTGGTGISKKDLTIEAVKPMFEKELYAFSVLFAKLSYDEIGSAAMMSRALAGIVRGKAVFLIPGSPKACRLAMEKIIVPEAWHIVKHMREC
jgi:molybdopterin adenylyltransferase